MGAGFGRWRSCATCVKHFDPATSGSPIPCKDRIGLLNVLLAEGLNLGLSKMAGAQPHMR